MTGVILFPWTEGFYFTSLLELLYDACSASNVLNFHFTALCSPFSLVFDFTFQFLFLLFYQLNLCQISVVQFLSAFFLFFLSCSWFKIIKIQMRWSWITSSCAVKRVSVDDLCSPTCDQHVFSAWRGIWKGMFRLYDLYIPSYYRILIWFI